MDVEVVEKNKGGRPTKLTPELIHQMGKYFEEGNHPECVSGLVSITKQTFYNWMETGEADFETGKDTIYARFFDCIKVAIGASERSAVKQMKAGGKDWIGAAEFLSRRFPERWRRNIAITGGDGGPLKVSPVLEVPFTSKTVADWQNAKPETDSTVAAASNGKHAGNGTTR